MHRRSGVPGLWFLPRQGQFKWQLQWSGAGRCGPDEPCRCHRSTVPPHVFQLNPARGSGFAVDGGAMRHTAHEMVAVRDEVERRLRFRSGHQHVAIDPLETTRADIARGCVGRPAADILRIEELFDLINDERVYVRSVRADGDAGVMVIVWKIHKETLAVRCSLEISQALRAMNLN